MLRFHERPLVITLAALGLLFAVRSDPPLGSAAGSVPIPEVSGPIPGDAPGTPGRNYPFLATDLDLAGRGYVEEEFFFSGTANAYDIPDPSGEAAPHATAKILSSRHEYKTRMMVRRPANAKQFNGVVLVEWDNVSGSFDNPVWWLRVHEFIMREGYAWVGIAAQRLAVHGQPDGLRNWSRARYGTLSIPDVGEPTPNGLPADLLSYDIFSQGIQAVRSVRAVMGGLPVRTVIAGGLSQSGGRVSIYVNAINPRHRIVDAVIQSISIGRLSRHIRTDLDIPVLKILSESEFENPRVAFAQPDTARFRTWWVTGTTHGAHYPGLTRNAIFRRDMPERNLAPECSRPPGSRIQWHHVDAASIDAVRKWVEQGVPPAHSPLPVWKSMDPPVLARDKHGNALGGIRHPSLAVPIAMSSGTRSLQSPACSGRGVHIPFETETLNELYPNHGAYVRAVTGAAQQSVRDGFLLEEDANELIRDAQSSIIGTGLVSGPLCANVKDFLQQPSTGNLRDHTQVYYFRDASELLSSLDEATRLVAEAYTAAEQGDQRTHRMRIQQAMQSVERYIEDIEKLPGQGRAQQVTVDLLVEFARALIDGLAREVSRTDPVM